MDERIEMIKKFVEEHRGERFDITLFPKHEHDVDRIDINNAEIGFEDDGEYMVITSKRGESYDIIGRLLIKVEDIIALIDFESEYGKDFEEKIDLLYEKYPGYRDGDNSTCYLETENFYTIYMEKGIF